MADHAHAQAVGNGASAADGPCAVTIHDSGWKSLSRAFLCVRQPGRSGEHSLLIQRMSFPGSDYRDGHAVPTYYALGKIYAILALGCVLVHYLVPYFRTARLKYHPEVASAGNLVEVGKLGEDALQALGWQSQ